MSSDNFTWSPEEGLQKGWRLGLRSSNKSFQPTETGIEMIDTDHSQRTLYIHNHKRC